MKFDSRTLFVIGNGFDIAHGLPTSYGDFRDYMTRTYKISKDTMEPPIQGDTLDGGYDYDENDIASFLFNLSETTTLNDKWQDFETALGSYCEVMETECLDDREVTDSEGDIDMIKTERVKTEICGDLFQSTKLIEFFTQWIKSIHTVTNPKVDFLNLINPVRDYFLSFNYTETLEILYHVKNICHIHGKNGENVLSRR